MNGKIYNYLLFLVKVDEMMCDELVVYDLMIFEFGVDESMAGVGVEGDLGHRRWMRWVSTLR